MFITIDTGTTNTRVALFNATQQRIDIVKSDVGVKNTSIDGHNQSLVAAIAHAVKQLKQRHRLSDNDIDIIIGSGMLTSNLGLVEVPHLVAPVSLANFSTSIRAVSLPEIANQPIYLIPGVKNIDVAAEHDDSPTNPPLNLDIMRGEEVETVAIAERYDIQQNAIIALPGSHSKFVAIDAQRTILGCCTTMAGELNAIVTHHTILTGSLENRFSDTLCVTSLNAGYQEAEQYGFGKALFSIRLNEQFRHWEHAQLASFLVGVVLQSDVQALTQFPALQYTPETPIYVGGKGLLCEATAEIFKRQLPNEVYCCNDIDDLSAIGALRIAEQAGLIPSQMS
ncbi:2-dehydro-3-deoxygalactonokinase [Enterovibrio sp. 27052020O]|uniref:2-dehydro-3-deoxygalactonokinase n=1 Tax=Enterovibrio sp. 27052020O TaxID=3241166 RepID=UPI00388E2266